jgi:hypothetical protein
MTPKSHFEPELPMPDAFMAEAHRIAAEYALRDPFRGPRERQERHAYYMREAYRAEGRTPPPAG